VTERNLSFFSRSMPEFVQIADHFPKITTLKPCLRTAPTPASTPLDPANRCVSRILRTMPFVFSALA
jgi:hypothetical protein